LERNKFGLGFEITTAYGQAKNSITEGSISWGGFLGTIYWADPKERLVCLLYLQQFPLSHSEIKDKYRVLVYQALDD
jgi:CubicO group peptidase (beta-lactamase class C family)